MTRAFTFTSRAQRVVFGAGEVDRITAHLDPGEGRTALLCTSGSYVRNGAANQVGEALGKSMVALFSGVRAHVPEEVVDDALSVALQARANTVVALGGGSVLGTAKAVAVALHDRRLDDAAIALVAIPTTYAGSEMTPVYGVTRVAEKRKVTLTDVRALPSLVLYDPNLTLALPADLTASTGVNALAHCIEGLYSTSRNPVSTAAALAGIEKIYHALPRCLADPGDAGARGDMLAGAYLAGTTIAHAGMALHHGICHVLGGSAGVPHGIANAIMLRHVMRFNLQTCAPELAAAAPSLGIEVTGASAQSTAERVLDATASFVRALGLPQRLREVGVDREVLPHLAVLAASSAAVRANPRPITAFEIEDLLAAAW